MHVKFFLSMSLLMRMLRLMRASLIKFWSRFSYDVFFCLFSVNVIEASISDCCDPSDVSCCSVTVL